MNDYNLYPDKDQAEKLKAGLARMAPGFYAELCGVCDGAGKYEQTYNAGCGMGYYRAPGPCDYCRGFGLTMGGEPAPRSVFEQVLGTKP